MTLRELIDRLTEIAETTDDQRDVVLAVQPAWPHIAHVMNVWDPADVEDFDGSEDRVFIAAGDHREPAPSAAWGGE